MELNISTIKQLIKQDGIVVNVIRQLIELVIVIRLEIAIFKLIKPYYLELIITMVRLIMAIKFKLEVFWLLEIFHQQVF